MAVAFLACAALLAQKPAPLTPALKAKVVAQIGTVLRTTAFVPGVDFTTWNGIARRRAKSLSAARTPEEFALALSEALGEYRVSHLAVIPPGQGPLATIDSFGFFSQRYEGKIVVTKVFAGTQAEKEGLRPGMILSTFEFPDYPSTNRIEVGYYDNSNTLRTVTVGKERFLPKEVPSLVWVDSQTCALTIPSFMIGYDEKLVEQLVKNAARFPNLIIDLRGNAGGVPEFAEHLLGAFLPAGIRAGAFPSKEILRDYTAKTHRPPTDRAAIVAWAPKDYAFIPTETKVKYTGHIAVLIDGGSGSASEVVALALRDAAQTPIFGRPSAGQVLAANGTSLPGGFSMFFPWRDYWTAKGERIEGHPIVPDVTVEEDSEEASILPYPLRKKASAWLNAKYPPKVAFK